jgi:DNA-directed RNA polymerase subunit beta
VKKIHARAIGRTPRYNSRSAKAHFGGQRLGNGGLGARSVRASYTLQEFLTVKSDDVIGRTRIFDSIVKGDMNFEPGLPESFKVLQKELQALALDVDLLEEEDHGRN